MFDRRTFLAATSAAALVPAIAAAQNSPRARLDALFAAFAREDLIRNPEDATSLGLDTGALASLRGRLTDESLAAYARDKAINADRLRRLRALDRTALSPTGEVDYDTVVYTYGIDDEANRRFRYGGEGVGQPYVISQLTGAYQGTPSFLDTQHPIANRQDAQDYLARLEAFAAVMDQEVEVALHDAALGVVPPDFIIQRALGQMADFRATPADRSSLVGSLARRTAEKGIPGDWAGRAGESGELIIG